MSDRAGWETLASVHDHGQTLDTPSPSLGLGAPCSRKQHSRPCPRQLLGESLPAPLRQCTESRGGGPPGLIPAGGRWPFPVSLPPRRGTQEPSSTLPARGRADLQVGRKGIRRPPGHCLLQAPLSEKSVLLSWRRDSGGLGEHFQYSSPPGLERSFPGCN